MASLHVASELVKAITNIIYPVGSIYISTNTANPASYLGGTWSQVAKDCYLIGYNASNTWFDKIGTSEGSNGKSGNWNTDYHTLTINEMPRHNHNIRTWHNNDGTVWGAGVRDNYAFSNVATGGDGTSQESNIFYGIIDAGRRTRS